MRPATCPICRTRLDPKAIVAAGPFRCSSCHASLQASESYAQIVGWGSVAVVIALFSVLGFRGLRLVCAVLLAFVPALYVSVNFAKYLLPPHIEPYLPEHPTLDLRKKRRK